MNTYKIYNVVIYILTRNVLRNIMCVGAYNEKFLSIILCCLARVSGTGIVTATAHPFLLYLFILKKGELAKVERQE